MPDNARDPAAEAFASLLDAYGHAFTLGCQVMKAGLAMRGHAEAFECLVRDCDATARMSGGPERLDRLARSAIGRHIETNEPFGPVPLGPVREDPSHPSYGI